MGKEIGVVGGGTMGKGIVRHFLANGDRVTLVEVNDDLASRARLDLEKAVNKMIQGGKLDPERAEQWLSRLVTVSDPAVLSTCGFVIETVPEDLEMKKTVLSVIEKHAAPGAIISTNTSALAITLLAAGLSSPHRFVGTHFFNPAHVMPLVEVVRGADTSSETVQRVDDLLKRTGKRPIVVKDCPGFLVNRILGVYINEALRTLEEGLAGTLDLDAAVEELGMPIGPVKLGDMVGWDVIHAANGTLARAYGERFALPRLLTRLDADKRHGIKTGKGLLDHATAPPSPTEDFVPASRGLDGRAIQELRHRILYAIIAEAARNLDEGVASAPDIDLAMVLGAGMPRGPLAWADDMGLGKVLTDLEALTNRLGPRFWPAPILRISADAGRPLAARK